jgi:hypothetical protein
MEKNALNDLMRKGYEAVKVLSKRLKTFFTTKARTTARMQEVRLHGWRR